MSAPARIQRRYLAAYAANAAAENIEAQLAGRRADARALDRHIQWLEELLAKRRAQIAAGEWPPGQSGPDPDRPDTPSAQANTSQPESDPDRHHTIRPQSGTHQD